MCKKKDLKKKRKEYYDLLEELVSQYIKNNKSVRISDINEEFEIHALEVLRVIKSLKKKGEIEEV